jgi:hypothetical protein
MRFFPALHRVTGVTGVTGVTIAFVCNTDPPFFPYIFCYLPWSYLETGFEGQQRNVWGSNFLRMHGCVRTTHYATRRTPLVMKMYHLPIEILVVVPEISVHLPKEFEVITNISMHLRKGDFFQLIFTPFCVVKRGFINPRKIVPMY